MGIMASDVALCALVLLQLLCAAHCHQGDHMIHGGRRQLELPKPRGLSTTAPNNTKVLRASLIHRDFLQTKGTNTSTTHPRGRFLEAMQRSRRRAAQLTSLSSPLTVLPQRSGSYVMQISFGTPPMVFEAEADTGSDLNWLHCSPCTNNGCNAFDPSASSTYKLAPCNDPSCLALGSTVAPCSSDGSTCAFTGYSYGDKSSAGGYMAYDTVTLDSAVPNIAFGCGYGVTGFDTVDGLIGLGRGALSLPTQLSSSSVVDEVFSYCLVDQASASQGTSSQLTFGSAAENSDATYTPMLTNGNNPFYFVGVTGISVGGSGVQIDASVFQTDGMGNGGVILDSGTTFSIWADVVFQAISNAFQSQITYTLAPVPPGFPTDLLCYDVSGVSDPLSAFPSMVVHMTNVDLTTPGSTLFELVGSDSDTACLYMSGAGTTQTFSIIGNVQQRNHLVVYDEVKQQVGFQDMDCASM